MKDEIFLCEIEYEAKYEIKKGTEEKYWENIERGFFEEKAPKKLQN